MSESATEGVLYFAYGTLLGIEEMQRLCETARPVAHASLADYEFRLERFGHGPADGGCALEPVQGAETKGVLYEVAATEWAHLRNVSGEHTDYKVIEVTVVDDEGENHSAQTLTIKKPIGDFRPSEDYIRKIVEGARSAELAPSYRARIDDLVTRARAVE